MPDTQVWLREILEGCRDAIFLADEQAAFVHVNQAACDLSGYGRDELLRMRIPDLHEEEDLGAFREHFAALLDGGSRITEALLRRKDGTRVLVEFSNRGLQIEGARFVHAVARDITERVEAERARELLGSLLEFAPVPIFVITADHRLRLANRAWDEATGRKSEQLVGRRFDEAFPHESGAAITAANDRMLATGLPVTTEETFDTLKGRRHFHTVKFPLHDANGRVEALGGISVDITEFKRMEDQARRDAAVVRALAARLAGAETTERSRLATELHDRVGQTLTALGINFNLLRMEIGDRAPAALWRLDFLQSLIEDTVACVRDVMADLRPPMLDDYGPMSALRAWIKHVSSLAPVEIAIDGDDASPRMPPRVENALFRIGQEALSNVVKHSQATRASVSMEVDVRSARLVVTDNGRGFTMPDGGVGTNTWGLLSMSERARAVGGRLAIESRPGSGTRVVVEVDR